ncbi:Fic family protein [Microbacterium sp. C7(2022)]|uniref:Fic family protein n=1 Tax=Microbacterium sp. C7(2022) TaxID=2992759 RepID=UPI00237AB8A9|nr:Fic family protein [Microbacterium sp. C7(2022)]MDE0547444.1 Fic family protein [Microbacterium sp. C7(2022)]
MASYVERLWAPEEHGQLSRRDREPGRFRAYIPDELGRGLPHLGDEARAAAEDALAVLARADERISRSGAYLNHLLIRSESISSSWIEGNRVTPKRLAIAEVLEQGPQVALDVIGNVRATEQAIATLADRTRLITSADIERLQHVIEPTLEPGLRTEQNWVGGTGWSPLRAEFVPPPESEVPRLVADLAAFLSETTGNPVVRAAIAHAQFEAIHPFIDGNGRTGRALIHTVLRRADALRNVLIPISTVFAGDTDTYIAGLTAYRADPPRLDEWVIGFARATELASSNAVRLADEVAALDQQSLDDLVAHRRAHELTPAVPRRDAVVLRILAALATEPVLTIESVARNHGVSTTAAHRALNELADAGILGRTKDQRGRLICWTADRHLALVALTERSNRVGAGDTANRAPRAGPPRPEKGRIGTLRATSRDD